MAKVNIGGVKVGPGEPVFLVAEIGINHNGSVELAKKLIDAAREAGCQAVKFQKRTVPAVYTPEELAKDREVPADIITAAIKRRVLPTEAVARLTNSNLIQTTNGDLKLALELTADEYKEIDRYCKQKGILWFASPWDEASVDFLERFKPPAYKIASASLTDEVLLRRVKKTGRPVILSTGMSTLKEIDKAVKILGGKNLVLMQCVSTYPAHPSELNLKTINTLEKRYKVPVGYSGHETGIFSSLAAVALGACVVERHITLNRAMWGSDQAASVEPRGIAKLAKEIRIFERALGDGKKRVLESEIPIRQKLRRKTFLS